MDEPLIKVERDGHLTVITINRPEVLNAINAEAGEGFNVERLPAVNSLFDLK